MTSDEASSKVIKLRALAAPGSGATPAEAAAAARIADQICAKFGVSPPASPPSSRSDGRALPGQVAPHWRPPEQKEQRERGWGWWEWAGRPFGASERGMSGITDAQARVMAIAVLSTGAHLRAADLEIIESALNGLLTEYGKLLLDGIYTLVAG